MTIPFFLGWNIHKNQIHGIKWNTCAIHPLFPPLPSGPWHPHSSYRDPNILYLFVRYVINKCLNFQQGFFTDPTLCYIWPHFFFLYFLFVFCVILIYFYSFLAVLRFLLGTLLRVFVCILYPCFVWWSIDPQPAVREHSVYPMHCTRFRVGSRWMRQRYACASRCDIIIPLWAKPNPAHQNLPIFLKKKKWKKHLVNVMECTWARLRVQIWNRVIHCKDFFVCGIWLN